jgi:cytochrome c biogenesis protein CcdA
MNARSRWLPFLALVWALAVPLVAQSKLTLEAVFQPSTAKPGDEVDLVLNAAVAKGYHAYGTKETSNIPVSVPLDQLELGGLERVGEPKVPEGIKKTVFGQPSYPLPTKFAVTLRLKVPAGAAAGAVAVAGGLRYQVCNENMCLAPAVAEFTASLTVEGATPAQLGTVPGLGLDPDSKLELKAALQPAVARAGATVTLVLDATVTDERYHAYGSRETGNLPVELKHGSLRTGGLELVGAAEVPPGEKAEHLGSESWPLPLQFQVKQKLRVPASATPGVIELSGVLDYQLCDENSCDLPAKAPFVVKLTIEAGAPVAPAEVQAPGGDSPFASWWALILACIGGGLFALAMPCTYPMIPITFSFFTKQAEKNQGNVTALALTYGFGIVAMFVLVGVGLSSVILAVVNHWLTNVVIGAMFFFFAFVLFGWINLNPPQSLQRVAGNASRSGGLLGVFFMGATLVITSFTCTAPIVGSLIANVAKVGTLRVGIGMAIFGLTMAAPFVVLSLMPGKVKSMPRSGEWMETLKVSLGFVELAAAFKFVSMVDFYFGWQVLPRELFLLLWTAIFVLWALYLFGILRKAGAANEGVSNGRMAGGMAVTLFATYFLFGALGYRLDFYTTNFIPGYSAESVLSRGDHEAGGEGGHKVLAKHTVVLDDGPAAIAAAKAADKLLLYNFTGFN